MKYMITWKERYRAPLSNTRKRSSGYLMSFANGQPPANFKIELFSHRAQVLIYASGLRI
jgi:hypothetical protein